ncbi:acetate--CoA ligase family protein [Bradyrhizobium sp.]|uniref:acetate--CoA ligase family protein n=1 Tax=Bradyrhizobium sp. TaxID=376 RepID=UPI0039E247ED
MREARASAEGGFDIGALIEPKSIAVVGVSPAAPNSWGYRTMRVLAEGGYGGTLYAVHPTKDVPGFETVRSLGDKPAPDLVAICVRAEQSVDVVRQAREIGAKAAIVFASNFAEIGEKGEQLQRELVEAAGDMPFLGPNCLGFSNRTASVKMSVAPFLNRPLLPPGPVALIAQSGALGLVLAQCVEESGVGYSHFISVGNESVVTAAMLARQLIERDDVGIAFVYLETLRDPQVLAEAAARAHALGKRIIVLKAGSSDAGRRAALSHTAAIAGNETLFEALTRDMGIVRIRDDEGVQPVLAALRRGWKMPERPRVAILSNSGGAGALLADRLVAEGARVEAFSEPLRQAIRKTGLVEAGDQNPLDIGGGWEALLDRVEPCLKVLDGAEEVDAVVVYYAFGDIIGERVAPIASYCGAMSKPAVFVWQAAPAEFYASVTERDVLTSTIGGGVRAVAAQMTAASTGNAEWRRRDVAPVRLPDLRAGQATIAEREAGAVLRELGVDVVDAVAVVSGQAAAAIEKVTAKGWARCVIKGNAADVLHRNRVGLVEVGVSVDRLGAVIERLSRRLDEVSADPHRCLLIQPMVPFESEIGVGGLVDPAYGPAILIGPGGINIEAAHGERHVLLLSASYAARAAFSARVEKAYDLSRGTVAGLVDGIERLLAAPEVREVDINPMVRTAHGGLIALDALIVVEQHHATAVA